MVALYSYRLRHIAAAITAVASALIKRGGECLYLRVLTH